VRSDQWFVLTSDQTPFVVHTLDHPSVDWEAGKKRPDGVLIAELDTLTLVCFLELKGQTKSRLTSVDPKERERAQLRGGIEHPGTSTHVVQVTEPRPPSTNWTTPLATEMP